MCIDFTDLNKAIPKKSYPLPHIDQLEDSVAGHELLIFRCFQMIPSNSNCRRRICRRLPLLWILEFIVIQEYFLG